MIAKKLFSTEGYDDGTFKPSKSISRGEMATLLAKTLGLIN